MRQAFHGADQIVAQVPHGAAREAGQAGHRDGRELPHAGGEMGEGILRGARALPARVARPALGAALAVAPHFLRLGAQERVARPALAAHERLEQEGERRPRDLGERGDGGVGVEQHFAHQGHHAAALGAGEEFGPRVAHLRAATR